MTKKIYCQPTDCDACKYEDCIGIIRKKPGRKALSDEERRRRNERSREYYRTHPEKYKEYYRQRCIKKNA